ncbi:hypothetical protein [Paraliomyxa miuraensis]|uniref:hypothetical protein n=1 Tax=Paraliomyxa miuraensis TaxID=376150 RepID=UPI0022536257|nr:hypothetical protein [Paraliomyxa miuraensis]MCX4243894.1 hypothetical protein [Paraliomyxa miuraensis]
MEMVQTQAPFAAIRCRYQDAQSTQTLREGLAEYRAANPGLFDPEALEKNESLGHLGRFFAAHDACHVLFGLSTSLADETLADTWTYFGTDVRWRELWSYFRSDAQKEFFSTFLSEVGYGRMLWSSLGAIPRVVRAIWRSRSMTRKWSLHDWSAHLDVPLVELRREFGIRPV